MRASQTPHWPRVLAVWLLIVVAESVHGVLRQQFLVPRLGDVPSRQLGVLTGSLIIFAIALATVRWTGARGAAAQLRTGCVWVVLMLGFEFALGRALGYPAGRMLADYDVTAGGYLGLGMLFLLFAPLLAARLRGVT